MAIRETSVRTPVTPTAGNTRTRSAAPPEGSKAAGNIQQTVTTTTKAANALKDQNVAAALDAIGSKSIAGQIREGVVNRVATKTAAVTGLGSVAANASEGTISALGDTKNVVGAADAVTGSKGLGKALGVGARGLGAVASAASLKGSVEKTINGEGGFAEAKTILTTSKDLKVAGTAAAKTVAKYGDDGVKVAKAVVSATRTAGGAAAKVAAKTGAKTAAKSAGRFVPGMNVAIAAVDTGIAASDIKKAVDNPTTKNVTKAVLGSITAAGSIAAASNVPGVSQVGAGVAIVSDVAKAAVDVDWGAVASDAKEVASKTYDQGKKMLGDAASSARNMASNAASSAWEAATSWW
jgi:hypothetical protein